MVAQPRQRLALRAGPHFATLAGEPAGRSPLDNLSESTAADRFRIEVVRTPAGPPLIGEAIALVEPDRRAIVAAGQVVDQAVGVIRLKGLLWRPVAEVADLIAEARQFGEPVTVPHPRLMGDRAVLADLVVELDPRAWQALALLTEGQDRLLRRLDLRPGDPATKIWFRRVAGRWGAIVIDPADWTDLIAELQATGPDRFPAR